jgi:hypothetical protein
MFLLVDRVLSGLVARPAGSEPAAAPAPPGPPAAAGRTAAGRLAVPAAILTAAVAAQFALAAHLRDAGALSFPPHPGPLDRLPLTVDDPATGRAEWAGTDLPAVRDEIRAQLPFRADDLLVRGYRGPDGGEAVLYAVHSRVGEDRKHHPEICVRDVGGVPEDLSFRAQVPLAADSPGRGQRFRFRTAAGRPTVIYYWHYTDTPAPDPARSRLQTLHLRLGLDAPSVTVQLSVGTDRRAVLESVERVLLPALDRAARRDVLPPGAAAGCDRIPIGLARR